MIKKTIHLFLLLPIIAYAGHVRSYSPVLDDEVGNTSNDSFRHSKTMFKTVYKTIPRTTIYCGGKFDADKNITDTNGVVVTKHISRLSRVEYEHVVPASKFGSTFDEWKFGSPICVKSSGKLYKGRKCANRANKEFRLMQADMYNLYPSIGAVNAIRSNFPYIYKAKGSPLGACNFIVDKVNRGVTPPNRAKGVVARASLYMQSAYPQRVKFGIMANVNFYDWNMQYPPSPDECKRGEMIAKIQGNVNEVLDRRCKTTVFINGEEVKFNLNSTQR